MFNLWVPAQEVLEARMHATVHQIRRGAHLGVSRRM